MKKEKTEEISQGSNTLVALTGADVDWEKFVKTKFDENNLKNNWEWKTVVWSQKNCFTDTSWPQWFTFVSQVCLRDVCCHILADPCDIVLNLRESNTFPEKLWFWRGTHQLNNNLPLQFLSLKLPLYLTPIVCCHGKTSPRHYLLWFAIEGSSYSESAQRAFVPPNYRDDDFNMFVCLPSSSVIVREIWWRHHPHVSEGEHGHSITAVSLRRPLEDWCHPERTEEVGLGGLLHICLSLCICLSLRTCHGKWW